MYDLLVKAEELTHKYMLEQYYYSSRFIDPITHNVLTSKLEEWDYVFETFFNYLLKYKFIYQWNS